VKFSKNLGGGGEADFKNRGRGKRGNGSFGKNFSSEKKGGDRREGAKIQMF